MHDLQLVGFTTDRRGLIFRPGAGARSDASFVVPVTAELAALVAEIAEEQGAIDHAEVEPADELAGGSAPAEAVLRPRSQLSVRDIQARLRAGESIDQVAAEAGVDDDWIERFAPPIRAEQRRVVERALEHHLQRSRSAPSAVPLRRAVGMALAEKGIAYTVSAFEAAWSAHLLGHDRWAVEFTYRHRGRDRTVTWSYDADADELTTSDRVAAQLGYVAPGTAGDADGQAIDGIVGDPEASTQIGTASAGKKRAAPAKKTAAGARAAAGRTATKKKAPKQKATKKTATKKTGPKKTATKKTATKKKAPAKKKATRKAAKKKAPAKKKATRKAAKKKAPAKKVATRKAAEKKPPAKRALAADTAAVRKDSAPQRATATKRSATKRVATTNPASTTRPVAATAPDRSRAVATPITPITPSADDEVTAAPERGSRPGESASRLPDESPRPGRGDQTPAEPAPTRRRAVAGRPGEVPITDAPLATRPPASNGRARGDDRPPAGEEGFPSGSDPAMARRARAAERSVHTVQFRSGSAAPVRAATAEDRVRGSTEPDRSRTDPARSNGAARPATRRRRQLRGR